MPPQACARTHTRLSVHPPAGNSSFARGKSDVPRLQRLSNSFGLNRLNKKRARAISAASSNLCYYIYAPALILLALINLFSPRRRRRRSVITLVVIQWNKAKCSLFTYDLFSSLDGATATALHFPAHRRRALILQEQRTERCRAALRPVFGPCLKHILYMKGKCGH